MKTQKNNLFLKKINFLLFKTLLWISVGLLFMGISIIIPINLNSNFQELLVFFCLVIIVNFHTSYLYPIISKKSKLGYIIILIGSVFICTIFEILIFSKNFDTFYYPSLDRKKVYLIAFCYIFIRNFAVFCFFLWVEYFNRLILLYYEKEKIYQKEIALLIEKQEFEKRFSRKKLSLHYFFNILEHFHADPLINHSNSELLDKVKFILYYFLVDAEKEKVELEKELAFYNYYIELEKLRHKKNISVGFNVLGQTEHYIIIPLLFEPLIGNAMKYTKQDGTGWIEITFDTTHFPVLNFHCKNNYDHRLSSIVSSENGLKILEQRLEFRYKNSYTLKIVQDSDFYEVMLSIKITEAAF